MLIASSKKSASDNFGTSALKEAERRRPTAVRSAARVSSVIANCSGSVRGAERWSAGIRSDGNPAPEVGLEFTVTVSLVVELVLTVRLAELGEKLHEMPVGGCAQPKETAP